MDNLHGDWAGTITGTNNADVFIEMRHTDNALSGTARINDKVFGTSIYHFTGSVEGTQVLFKMKPEAEQKTTSATVNVNNRAVRVHLPTTNLGDVTVQGTIRGQTISGKWTSTIGTGGAFQISKVVPNDNVIKDMLKQLEDRLFVMMSISSENPELEDVLSAIKRASKNHGIDCTRVDEVESSGKLTDLILDHIDKSRYLICDVSTERPNVYYVSNAKTSVTRF